MDEMIHKTATLTYRATFKPLENIWGTEEGVESEPRKVMTGNANRWSKSI